MQSPYIFFPSSSIDIPPQRTPRFFFRIDGVLANFTTIAALLLDDLQLPNTPTGIFEEEMLKKHFVPEVLYDICNGQEFWESVPVYDWSWLLFEKAFTLSRGDVHFLGKANLIDPGSWAGKAAWVHKNFGRYGIDRLSVRIDVTGFSMLSNGRQDIFVSAVMEEVNAWTAAGGTGLYFPEIDVRWPAAAGEVAKRLTAMQELVDELRLDRIPYCRNYARGDCPYHS
jgi:hypothetical protein